MATKLPVQDGEISQQRHSVANRVDFTDQVNQSIQTKKEPRVDDRIKNKVTELVES